MTATALLGPAGVAVVERAGVPLLVMDTGRRLRYVSPAARALLGYGPGDPLAGRCRGTTRGTDCDDACPLTWALERGVDVVEEFPTRYARADGSEVAVRVTVIVVRDGSGRMAAAVELLRPDEALGSWVLEGRSAASEQLRLAVRQAAASSEPVWIAGEAVARLEVARALHSARELPAERFAVLPEGASWVPAWPAGTVYVEADPAAPPDPARVAPWVLVAGAPEAPAGNWQGPVVRVPALAGRREDLPAMFRAWLAGRAPGRPVAPAVVARLAEVALREGLGAALEAGEAALAAVPGPVTESALAGLDGRRVLWLDDLLSAADPIRRAEAEVVRAVMEGCGWRVGEAARRLGVSRVTLWRKLKEHGIERP